MTDAEFKIVNGVERNGVVTYEYFLHNGLPDVVLERTYLLNSALMFSDMG